MLLSCLFHPDHCLDVYDERVKHSKCESFAEVDRCFLSSQAIKFIYTFKQYILNYLAMKILSLFFGLLLSDPKRKSRTTRSARPECNITYVRQKGSACSTRYRVISKLLKLLNRRCISNSIPMVGNIYPEGKRVVTWIR